MNNAEITADIPITVTDVPLVDSSTVDEGDTGVNIDLGVIGDSLTCTSSPPIPSDLTLNADSCTITGDVNPNAVTDGSASQDFVIAYTITDGTLSDTGTYTLTVDAIMLGAVPVATLDGTLTEANLFATPAPTVTVTLANTEYAAPGTLMPSHFSVTDTVDGTVSVSDVTRDSDTVATLTLAYSDEDITADGTLSVTLAAAGHTGTGALMTGTIAITATVRLFPPAAVGSLAIESISGTDVTLTWSAPSGVITGYDITRMGPDGVRNVDANFASDAAATETVTFTDTVPVLSAGIAYTYEVSAFNNAGFSPAASVSTPLVLISPSDLTIDEGETAVYTVALGSAPGGQVTVEISGAAGHVNVSPTSLTFTAADTPQTVTVTGVEDDDNAIDGTVSLIHAFTGGVYDGVSVPVVVSVSDNDRAVLSVMPVTVSEGDTATVAVRLDRAVASGFTVGFDTLGGTATEVLDYADSMGTLTFTGSAGEVQTFTVATEEDTVSENDETVLVSLSGVDPSELPIGGAGGRAHVAVTIADNDPGARLSASSVTVEEGGSTTYTLVLTSQPTDTVTVAIDSNNNDVSARGGSSDGLLFFNNTNLWNVPQAVTVSAAEDNDNTDNERAVLTHRFSGGGYNAVSVGNVNVSVTDNDEAILSIMQPGRPVVLEEGGAGQTFTVTLSDAVSGGSFAVAVEARAGTAVASDYTVSPASLTFVGTEGEVQEFTVTAVDDDLFENVEERFTVVLGGEVSFVGTNTVAPVGTAGSAVELSIARNDLPGIVLTELGETTVATEVTVLVSASVSYAVKLASQPSGDVTVEIMSTTSGLTVSPSAPLTFTAGNWNAEQTVAVSASGAAQSGLLVHTSSGNDYDDRQFLSVTVVDELRFEATVSEQIYQDGELVSLTLPAAVGGDGSAISYSLAGSPPPPLNPPPSFSDIGLSFDANTRVLSGTVDVSSSDFGDNLTLSATDGTDTAGLTFRVYAFTSVPHSVTDLTASSLGGGRVILRWDVDPSSSQFAPDGYHVQVPNNATGEFVVCDIAALAATRCFDSGEPGESRSWLVDPVRAFDTPPARYRLRAFRNDGSFSEWMEVNSPGGDFAVSPPAVVGSLAIGSIRGTAVTLTWSAPAGVITGYDITRIGPDEVRNVLDANFQSDAAATETVTFADTVPVLSAGLAYTYEVSAFNTAGYSPAASVSTPLVVISPSELTIGEGETAEYTVALGSAPGGPVTVEISGAAGHVNVSPTSLTFTAADTPQTVTVTGVEDDDNARDGTVSLIHAFTGGDYDGVSVPVGVSVVDNDRAELSVLPVTVPEGAPATVSVRLDRAVASGFTVRFDTLGGTATDVSDYVDSSGMLTFTGSAGQVRTFTVATEDDTESENDETVLVALSGVDPSELPISGADGRANVAVTILDNDPGARLSASSVTVEEGGEATYTVVLTSDPTGPVTVSIRSNNNDVSARIGSSDGLLFFNNTNPWNVPQAVTVSAAEDNDNTDNERAVLTHSFSGGGYNAVSVDNVDVSVTDNDEAILSIMQPGRPVVLEEGGAGRTFTVTLSDAVSGGSFAVAVEARAGTAVASDYTVSPASLTFAGTAGEVQTFTVTAVNDDLFENVEERFTVGLGGEVRFVGTNAVAPVATEGSAVELSIAANDRPGIVLTELGETTVATEVMVLAGTSVSYAVKLASQPGGAVTVAIESTTSELTVMPASLAFTAGNWNAEQTVAVSASGAAQSGELLHTASGSDYDETQILRVAVGSGPQISIAAVTSPVTEGTAAIFTLTANPAPASDLTVMVTVTGTGDFIDGAAPTMVTINAAATTATLTVPTTEDRIPEVDGTITATVDTGTGYTVDSTATNARASVTIEDAFTVVVTDLTASSLGGGRVILRWAAGPVSSLDGYHIQVQDDATVQFVDCDIAALAATRCFDSGEPGESRSWLVDPVRAFETPPARYRLRAFRNDGSVSEWVEVNSPGGAFALSPPEVVGGLAIGSISGTNVTLTWSAPAGVITGYDITRIGPDGVRNVLDANFQSDAAATETVTFADTVPVLNAGIVYTYEVSAFNDAGYSPAASVSTPLVVISPSELTIGEGETAVYTVALGSAPGGQVTVEISGAAGHVNVSPTSLTFTAADTPQTVTVTGVEDADARDGTVSLIHAFTGGDYNGVSVPVGVSVVDNDRAVLSVMPVTVSEGATATVSVRLDSAVASGFTVRFDTLGGTATEASDYVDSMGVLTFTGSAGEEQTFTVATMNDTESENDETVLVSLSGVDPSELPIGGAGGRAHVAVTIADNDQGARLSASSVTVEEGGEATYTLVLTSEPPPTPLVQVSIDSNNNDVSALIGQNVGILFFSNTNWNVPQEIRVRVAEDNDNTDDERAVLTHRFSNYGSATVGNVDVSVTDNDEAILSIMQPGRPVALVEGGAGQTFTVTLSDTVSGGSFAVAVEARAGTAVASDYTVSPASLTFAGTAGEVQTFTVTAVNDDLFENVEERFTVGLGGEVRFVVTNAVAPVATEGSAVELSIAANDRPGIVLTELGETAVATEVMVLAGTSVSYAVKLASQPGGDVTVAIVSTTSELTVMPASLAFTAGNWNGEQTVAVSASGAAQSGELLHTASGSDYDETQILRVAVGSGPQMITDLTASSLGGGRIILRWAVDPGSSPLTPDGYHIQVQDDATVQFVDCDIAALAATRCFDSGEPGESRSWLVNPVRAFETPPARYRLRAFRNDGSVSEWVVVDSPAGAFALSPPAVVGSLAIESISGRVVTLTWDASAGVITGYDITRIGPDGVRNVLDANFQSDAAASQTVTFTDTVPGLSAGLAYTYEVSAFNTAGYSPAASVSTPLVVISPSDLTINEGETAEYTVALGSAPGGQVTVAISGAAGHVNVSPTSLTFTAADTPQTVTVTGVEDDDDARDGTVSLIHAFTGGDYDGVSVPVGVSVVDNDRAELSVLPVTVPEGAPATVSVRLDSAVASGFTVRFDTLGGTATEDSDYAASMGMLTFTGSAGETQTFTVVTEDDAGSENDETVLVSLSGVDPSELPIGGAGGRAHVAVTIADNDPGARLSASSVTVEEGGEATYTVVLTSDPTGPVTVSIRSNNNDVSARIGSSDGLLFFNNTNPWNVPQAVTVSAAEDNDNTDNERAVLTHSFSGGGYNAVSVDNVDVSVTDNDEVIFNTPPVFVTETVASQTYTVGTSIGTFTLLSATGGNGDLSYALTPRLPNGLTFTAADRTITGTPEANTAQAATLYTYTASDSDIDTSPTDTATLTFTITITDAFDESVARLTDINETILPEIARAMTDNTVNAITQRVERAAAGPAVTTVTLDGKTVSLTALAKSDTLAGALDDQSTGVAALLSGIVRTATNKSWHLDRALGNSSFVMPMTSQNMISRLTLWGGGDYRNLSGETNTLDWDGDILSYRVGADAQVSDRVLAGVAVSWQSGEFDYADNTTSTTGRGAYEVEQTSVHPYLGWTTADGRLSLWATLGYGFGDVVLDDPDIDTQTSDLITRSVAVGGSGDLLQAGATTLRIKGQLQHTQVEVEGNTDLLRELTLDARRIRVALEGTHEYQFANGARLAPTVEVGLRQDGGDGRTGSGAEVGGGLRFTDTVHGLTVESRGRVLLAHSGNYQDWGVGGTIRFAPGQAGRGMAFSLVPSYGATASRVASLWAQELAVSPTANAASPTPRNGKMDVDLSYGLAWAGADALITPYSRLSLTNTDTHAYRVGSRLQMQDGLAFNLEALRREAATKPVEHGILLKLQLDW